MWTGVTPGDGPQEFHLVLLDNGRTAVLGDPDGRDALHCIRCSACLNVCPVYERTGGHAYGSVYPGPIGAVLSPQLTGIEGNASLPYASSLCGACYDACPVAIDIPSMLVHLRGEHVEAQQRVTPEALAFRWLAKAMANPRLWRIAQKTAGLGRFLARGKPTLPAALPPPASKWTRSRDLPTPPRKTFTQQWAEEHGR
jgi:L-lactate dehydrogenase complex protein LldF